MEARGKEEGIYASKAKDSGFIGKILANEEAGYVLADRDHGFTALPRPRN